ncbi:endonuclease [Mangrovimonas spongiae]|uniref:T9SS C-terminal target domain-containing protein n=1 Tax=Mangrovimonas spongiae TaxID=2494697 RepID=A0A3R9NQF8_9FLAO|nr:endonuclease [Mangrovimonas spongiae]RSK39316.1 T9SS C-terminal target domain-containing protein [Mangrovimonas spongiae]
MKQFYSLFLLLITTTVFAQVPAGYYDSATGTGYTLKTQLKEIIDDTDDNLATEYLHNDQGYNAMDGFIATYDLDNYYETGSNTILDPYSENPTGTDPYTFSPVNDECGNYVSEGDCYNKEHVIPQSVFSEQTPMRSDAHHLLPTDGRVNGFRSNFPFGVVDNSQLVSQSGISNPTQNGSKLGGNLDSGYSAGYSGTVFEPIDEFKGDIARIYFYFVTRYEDNMSNWSAYAMFDGSNNKAIADPFLNILITWHQNDPVSQKEIDRNNNIFNNHQSNRNPFVDHPEWVAEIWNVTPDTEAPTAPTNLVASNPTDTSIDLNWSAATDNIAVTAYDIYVDGVNTFNTNTTNFTATGLQPDTNYCFTIVALDAAGNESGLSNQDCETTTNNGSSGGVDIFFSEYIEGGSNNKALEIANFTGADITDMSSYSLKLSSNGNSSWTTTYSFPGNAQIAHEDVYVIANGSATICTSEYDDLNNSITGFNGNDAIGLFKNDVLIDIIGTLGDGTTFAENTTLVRKPTVSEPTTTFNINEWDSYPQDNCDDLGNHQTLSIKENHLADLTIYPNPVKGNYIRVSSNKPLQYEVYNILGRLVNKGKTTNGTIAVQMLNSGVYILKLSNGNQQITKKLIKK